MRVGITGASGLIGSQLCQALEERGDEVIRFVRPETKSSASKVVRWNPGSGDVDENDLRAAGGFDAVIHLAGAGIGDKRWSKSRKNEILNSRLNTTQLLVSALQSMNSGVPHLLSGSAIGFYGSRGDESLTEASSRGTGFLSEVCVEWENAAAPFANNGGSVAFLRTGIVMTKAGGALKKQLPLFQLGLGGKLASGRQWISPISLNDEIRSIIWTMDKKLSGPVNLVSPNPVTNTIFTKALGAQLKRPTLLAVPGFALKIVLGSEMADQVVFSSTKVLPSLLEQSGFAFQQRSIEEILNTSLS
jgi:uncharacterized protein (TIGR01777 family)